MKEGFQKYVPHILPTISAVKNVRVKNKEETREKSTGKIDKLFMMNETWLKETRAKRTER